MNYYIRTIKFIIMYTSHLGTSIKIEDVTVAQFDSLGVQICFILITISHIFTDIKKMSIQNHFFQLFGVILVVIFTIV